MSEGKIHAQAQVSREAKLGAGVQVGAFALVGAGVELGDECVLLEHAVVRGPAKFGPRNAAGAYERLLLVRTSSKTRLPRIEAPTVMG